MSSTARRRPTPFEWLWYAFGGRLSVRLRDWVRADLTGRTWVLRHVCRTLVQSAVPVVLLLTLLPGPIAVRVGTAMLGVIVAVYYSTTYVQQIRMGRLIKHGWPADLGIIESQRRDADVRRAADEAYAAAWRTPSDSA